MGPTKWGGLPRKTSQRGAVYPRLSPGDSRRNGRGRAPCGYSGARGTREGRMPRVAPTKQGRQNSWMERVLCSEEDRGTARRLAWLVRILVEKLRTRDQPAIAGTANPRITASWWARYQGGSFERQPATMKASYLTAWAKWCCASKPTEGVAVLLGLLQVLGGRAIERPIPGMLIRKYTPLKTPLELTGR